MLWFFLALLYIFGSSVSNILRKVLLKDDKGDAIAEAIVFQILGGIIVGIVAFSKGFVFPPIFQYRTNFLLQSVLWGSSTLLLFKAYEYIEASEVTIIFTIESIVAIFSAIFFLKESLTGLNVIGIVLIIISVVVIASKPQSFTLNKGILYAVLSSALAGLGVTNDTYMLHNHLDALSYLTIGFLTPGIFMMIVRPKALAKIKPLFSYPLFLKMFTFTFFYSIAGIMFFLSLALGAKASVLTPITQSSAILTILFAVVFLKETDNLTRKIICTIIVFIGVVLLS